MCNVAQGDIKQGHVKQNVHLSMPARYWRGGGADLTFLTEFQWKTDGVLFPISPAMALDILATMSKKTRETQSHYRIQKKVSFTIGSYCKPVVRILLVICTYIKKNLHGQLAVH